MATTRGFDSHTHSQWQHYADNFGPAKTMALLAERTQESLRSAVVYGVFGLALAATATFAQPKAAKVVSGLAAAGAFCVANSQRKLRRNLIALQEELGLTPPVPASRQRDDSAHCPYKLETRHAPQNGPTA